MTARLLPAGSWAAARRLEHVLLSAMAIFAGLTVSVVACRARRANAPLSSSVEGDLRPNYVFA